MSKAIRHAVHPSPGARPRASFPRAVLVALAAICLLLSTVHFSPDSVAGQRPHGFVHWHKQPPASQAGVTDGGGDEGPASASHEDSPAKKRRTTSLSVADEGEAQPLPFHLQSNPGIDHTASAPAAGAPFAAVAAAGSPLAPSLRLNRGQAPPLA